MKKINISKDISLPVEMVTQAIAILAKRRVGKSYTMRRIAEQLLAADQQVVLVDPKGDQWGIRSSADGKKPGFSIVILGGEHGDLPLEVNAGEVVAKLVVEDHVNVLLDLSMFRKHEVATFMAIFLENLYRLKAQERFRTPVMVILDEGDAIAPQKPQKGEERMLGAVEDLVRRGGQRGLGCILITQRSAVLNKNVLTQAEMLIVLRTIAPQDLAAMKAWIDVHGSAEEGKILMDSLPSLPIGDAWFWSPGWPTAEGIFTRTHILPITTFDSAATPAPGQKKMVPKNLADVDLGALKNQMAATIEKAKQEDPKLLRKRIAELERGLSVKKPEIKSKVAVDPKEIQKEVNLAVQKAQRVMEKEYEVQVESWVKILTGLVKSMLEKRPTHNPYRHIEIKTKVTTSKSLTPIFIDPKRFEKTDPYKLNWQPEGLTGPEQRILDAIAWANGIGIAEPEHAIVAFLAGYSNPRSTGYTNPRGALVAKNMVSYPQPGKIALTAAGKLQAASVEVGSEEELHRIILSRLTGPQAKILKVLIEARGEAMSNEDLARATGYENERSTGYTNPRGQLRSYGLIHYLNPGHVAAEDILFIK